MGRLLIWQLSRRQSLTPFTRRVSHKHSLPKKLAVHRVLYPSMLTESWVEGKSVEKKMHNQPRELQPYEDCQASDSRIWVNFTRNGLRRGSRHQEPPHTDVSRNLATVVVRGILPGLKRRRTGLLPSGRALECDQFGPADQADQEKKKSATLKVSLLFNNRHTLGPYRCLNQSEIVKGGTPPPPPPPDWPWSRNSCTCVCVWKCVFCCSQTEREVSSRDARIVPSLATFQTPQATFFFFKKSD